jgi:predicted Fe-Mo cluster-binding NifX family protein
MKVAISAEGTTLDAPVDPRFGRARYFLVVDTEAGSVQTVDNAAGVNALQGAGPQTAQRLAALGVEAVLTGHVGPKAFDALRAGKIAIYQNAQGSVKEVLQQFQAGRLAPAAGPSVSGRW